MPLFQGIKIHELARILSKAQLIAVDQGEILMHKGSAGDWIYIVCQGSLSADDSARSGEWTSGDIVGELACMDPAAQLVSVHCKTKALLLAIACDAFKQILLQSPVLALNRGSERIPRGLRRGIFNLCAVYSRWHKAYHQRLVCLNGKSRPANNPV